MQTPAATQKQLPLEVDLIRPDEKAGLDVIMLATPEIEEYARQSRRCWKSFCDARGYSFYHYKEKLLPDMHVNWSKVEMVRRHMQHSQSSLIVLVDADTYVCRSQFNLEELAGNYMEQDLVFALDCRHVGPFLFPLNYEAAFRFKTRKLPNAGFIIIRNNAFCRNFFDDWLKLARGELGYLANSHPRNQQVLWEGLYFKHKSRIALLGRIVERVLSPAHIMQAKRRGTAVVHVKGGVSEAFAKEIGFSTGM